ncbi:MAG: putative signal transducing protein [Bdellovibrionota bacterium]
MNKQINWTTVRSFTTPVEAHLARAYLESEGVEALIRDEHSISMRPYLSSVLGGVRVVVHEENHERASELLDLPPAEREPRLCPNCGEPGTEVLDRVGWAASIFSTLFTIAPARALKPLHGCAACGKVWRK